MVSTLRALSGVTAAKVVAPLGFTAVHSSSWGRDWHFKKVHSCLFLFFAYAQFSRPGPHSSFHVVPSFEPRLLSFARDF